MKFFFFSSIKPIIFSKASKNADEASANKITAIWFTYFQERRNDKKARGANVHQRAPL
jgi:hypothetical protein